MKLNDEQMVDALREAGHEEAATALEQKINAQTAAGDPPPTSPATGRQASPSAGSTADVHGPQRMARAYGQKRDAEAKAAAGDDQ